MAVEGRLLTIAEVPKWEQYIAQHPCSTPFHSSRYGQVLQSYLGLQQCYWGLWSDQNLVAILPLSRCPRLPFGHQLVTLPFAGAVAGLCADDECYYAQLLDSACDWAAQLAIRPLVVRLPVPLAAGLAEIGQGRDVFSHFLLPLASNSGDIFHGQLSPAVRTQIRKAQKLDYQWQIGSTALVNEFYSLYQHRMRQLGSPSLDQPFFIGLLGAFPEEMAIAVVRLRGQAVAALWLWFAPSRVGVAWAAARTDFNHLAINVLNYWKTIEWAVSQGYRSFDFGRSVRCSSQAHFKKKWGAHEIPMRHIEINTTDRVSRSQAFDPTARIYRTAARIWTFLPPALDALLSTKLVRYFP